MPVLPDFDEDRWAWAFNKKFADELAASRTNAASVTAATSRTATASGHLDDSPQSRDVRPLRPATYIPSCVERRATAIPVVRGPGGIRLPLRRTPSKMQRPREPRRTQANGFRTFTKAFGTATAVVPQLNVGATGVAETPLQQQQQQHKREPPTASAKFRDLPEMPHWFVGLMAGMLTFGRVMAIVLWFVNFPRKGKWRWMSKLRMGKGRRKYGYQQLVSDDNNNGRSEGRYGGRAESRIRERVGFSSDTDGAQDQARRRKNLSVDTSRQYVGLGIAVPGNGNNLLSPSGANVRQRRRSYDEERLGLRAQPPLSPARFAWEALTAPMPNVSTFTPSITAGAMTGIPRSAVDGGRTFRHESELESGTYSPPEHHEDVSDAESVEMFDPRSPYYQPYASKKLKGRGSGVFERLGEGMEHAAGRVAKVLSDQVKDDAEEGLLLPIRREERESVSW